MRFVAHIAALFALASTAVACERIWRYAPARPPDQASEASTKDASAADARTSRDASAADARAADAGTSRDASAADARAADARTSRDATRDAGGQADHGASATCTIDGATYHDQTVKADNACYICDPKLSPFAWSPAPGCVITLTGAAATFSFADGAFSEAKFNSPHRIAIDSAGQIYVTDAGNNRIRRIAGGEVETLAGDGAAGYVDGPGAHAQFNGPHGLALDGQGALYVADEGNRLIRKLSLPTQAVSTVAGGSCSKYGDDELCGPVDVAANTRSGTIYVADCVSNCIHAIVEGQVSRFAGSCSGTPGDGDGALITAGFSCPAALLFVRGADAAQDVLYVADSNKHRIRKIASGIVSTLAGSGTPGYSEGPALQARFYKPYGLALAADGALLVADSLNHRIRRIANGSVGTVAGTGTPGMRDGPALETMFNRPIGIAVRGSVAYIADDQNCRIRVLGLP